MRILVVGAGAVGGYFGGRLLEAGREVTFLVRPARAARLAETGLVIASRFGDAVLPAPPTVSAEALHEPFDLILLSCKAYDLGGAMESIAPAVGPETTIVPLLNGMRHLDILDVRFGAGRVLGGRCLISARLDEAGRIVHLNNAHELTFGERAGGRTARSAAIAEVLAGARFEARASDSILLDMWEKWVFIATMAGITCLMRASIGDVVAAGGTDLASSLLEECRAIAASAGWSTRPESLERSLRQVTEAGSPTTASMLADVERGSRTEADHILGDLLLRRRGGVADTGHSLSLLKLAYTALKAYEARTAREKA